MRFLITGATGFIGTHLCHRLVSEGHEIIALVRNSKKAKSLPQEKVHVLKGDLSRFKDPNLELPRCDLVIHLAGIIAAPRVRDYYRYNYDAVVDLVECLKRQSWKPQRMLFASSLAAAGPTSPEKPKTEEDKDEPNEAYGRSKLEAEQYLKNEALYPVTSFRPGAVYGPGDPAFLTIFKMASRGYGFKVARLNPGFSYIYVDDLVDAITQLASDTSTVHRTYFTTHPEHATINEMWDVLSTIMDKKIRVAPIPKALLYLFMLGSTAASKIFSFTNQLDIKQYKQITAPAYLCSSRALQDDFDWKPRYNLAECIKKTAEGYREAGWL
jgi:nucleoside-diphosphate-sugar epimerase